MPPEGYLDTAWNVVEKIIIPLIAVIYWDLKKRIDRNQDTIFGKDGSNGLSGRIKATETNRDQDRKYLENVDAALKEKERDLKNEIREIRNSIIYTGRNT